MLHPRRFTLPPLLASVAFLSLLFATVPQRIETIRAEYNIFSAPPLSTLPTPVIEILTLGHKNLYEDFINIWLLQTLVDNRKGSDAEAMMNMIRSVFRHHPKFETTYMLSCMVMYSEFNRPDYCQEIILSGLKAFPTSWRLPMTQGYVQYFHLKQPAQAASFFMMAASRPKSPAYVQNIVKKLLSSPELTADDLQKSLEIISSSESNPAFIQILRSVKDQQAASIQIQEIAPQP
jgi:hypothetical protein